MTAKYELITYNGKNEKYVGKKVRLYPDGTIKNDRGHWVERPENGSAELITSENARSLSRARWQKYQDAAADAVTQELASIAPSATTPFAAWGVLNARTAVAIMDSDKPRGRDLEYIGRNIGAIPTAYDNIEAQQSGISISEGAASKLLDLIGGVVRQDVDVVDVDG